MANQFNTTTHYTQTTSDNTPNQSQMIDEAVQINSNLAHIDSISLAICHLEMVNDMVSGIKAVLTNNTTRNTNTLTAIGMIDGIEYMLMNCIADHQNALDGLKGA